VEDSLQREDVENMSRENMKNLHEIMQVGQPAEGGCGEHVKREHEKTLRDHAGIVEDSLQREDVENMSRENMKKLHNILLVSGGQPPEGGCGEHVQREHEEPPRDQAGIVEDSLQKEDVENMSRENAKNLHEIMQV
jgi:hypothetical protein